jgi:hypothetical protein
MVGFQAVGLAVGKGARHRWAKSSQEKHKREISSTKGNGRLLSKSSRKPYRHSITPYPDIPLPLSTQHLLAPSK